MTRDHIEEFFATATAGPAGAVAGPFPSRREAILFRSRANTYRRSRRVAGDRGLDRLVLRLTKDNQVVAAPLAAPPIRALEPGDFA